MSMFKTKRASLVRRLWRSRVVSDSGARDGATQAEGTRGGPCGKRRPVTHAEPEDVTESGDRDDEEQDDERGAMCVQQRRAVPCCLLGDCCLRTPTQDEARPQACADQDLAGAAHAFLKRLKEQSLDALLQAVESRGSAPGECVLVPSVELRLGEQHVSPQYVVCRTFRWSDLQPSDRLKALCFCQSHGDAHGTKECCNPYHYSRLCGPESPPPPYSVSHSQEHKPLDAALSNTETVPTLFSSPPHVTPRDYTDTGTSLGSSTAGSLRSRWCSVAYWEQRTRVGRLYPAYEPSLSIFYDLPQGTGLCLSQLHANAYHSRRDDPGGHVQHSHGGGGTSSGSAQQSRSKIGFGIVLSQESDGVWVYNRSLHPVFVHSPTLDPPSARGLSVKRVMPGFSLKVFDYERSSWMAQHGVKPETQEGPWDPHSIRISFAKGWGPCYSRQFITSCPCWLEVLLNNHR